MRTPWGDEIEGATRTAKHVGAKLEIVDVTADEIQSALLPCMRLLQTSDAESVAIHVLVTMALEMGGSTCLVTGLGSDLLNASGDVGMESASGDLVERLVSVSGSGLMSTFEERGGSRLFHPYWTPSSIAVQLSVPRSLKSRAGVDKYYLRELGSRRLPAETAYGRKVAIHQGSGLVPGLEAHIGISLQDYCSREWDQLVAQSTRNLESIV
jgi:asparagine synthetase B (glutamine-hydrolysing)